MEFDCSMRLWLRWRPGMQGITCQLLYYFQLADDIQMLLVSISLVMPQASKEFTTKYATLLSAAQYAGLFLGAVLFGVLADLTGRRLAWQLSIFGVAAFTTVCASSPNWAILNFLLQFAVSSGAETLRSIPPKQSIALAADTLL